MMIPPTPNPPPPSIMSKAFIQIFLLLGTNNQLLDGRKSRHVAADGAGVSVAGRLARVPGQRGPGAAHQTQLDLAQPGPARAQEGNPGDAHTGKHRWNIVVAHSLLVADYVMLLWGVL